MSEQPVVSIIIISYNTRELLRNCLKSILENHPQFPFDILVVDNASTDESSEMVAAEFQSVRLIKNQNNVGFARANNQGIKETNGKYLLLLNSDTEVLPGALEGMVRAMEANPKAGVVGCRLLNADHSLQRSLRTFPNYFVHTVEIAELYRLLPVNGLMNRLYPYNSDHRHARWIDWVSGASFMVRREALEQVGLMDEDYFMYGEEMDWCYRMGKDGWFTFFTPEAKVVHIGGGSSTKSRGKLIVEQYRSLYRFYRKHYSSSALIGLKLLVFFLTLPKVLVLLVLERGKPHRRELRRSYWEVACLGFRENSALRK